MLKNRKGIELGINTIVIIAIALLVLLIIAGFFFGGFGKIGGAIGGIGEGAEEEAGESGIEGEIEDISDWGWDKGSCTGTFDCRDAPDMDMCYLLMDIGKCQAWRGGGVCGDDYDVSCGGLSETTCNAVGCTWVEE